MAFDQTTSVSNPSVDGSLKNKYRVNIPPVILIVLLAVLFALFSVLLLLSLKSNNTKQAVPFSSSSTKFQPATNGDSPITPVVTNDIGIYDEYFQDNDGDVIANFIEEELGTDPNNNECVREAGCSATETDPIESKQKNILFIFDSSGSMAATTATGQTKIEAAKAALRDHIAKIDPSINIGLMVYGHKGSNSVANKALSCAGIEMFYPLGKPDKNQFTNSVVSFGATGWTPIADSLKKAKNEVFTEKKGEDNYIVLISDGEETCGGNPERIAQELKDSGISTRIDVIGFGVDSSARTQLQSVALNGGGKYFDVNDFNGLAKVFNDIYQQYVKLISELHCSQEAFGKYATCINNKFTNYATWTNKRFFNLIKDPSKKAEALFLRDEYNPLVYNFLRSSAGKSKDQYNKEYATFLNALSKLQEKNIQTGRSLQYR